MREDLPVTHDVVIAGAGPVGLLLACELRLAGASVQVLEQAEDPYSPLKVLPFGMRGLTAPSTEALQRRGLLEQIPPLALTRPGPVGNAAAAHWMDQPRQPGGHFAGIAFFQDRIDSACWPYRLPDATGPSRVVDMASLEAALTTRALALGVQIRRGAAVVAIDTGEDGVRIDAGGQTYHARWLVGCDGGRSAVRKLGGFAFEGTDPEFTGYSVQVTLADPAVLPPGRHYTPTGMYTYTAPGTIAMVEFDAGACHRQHPITQEHVQAVLRRVTGVALEVAALHQAATWTDRARQATTYRNGRVLLAGDAAHVHSPLGGQGLSLGLGDAMNLGWKLAATLRGDAPPGLLDTYSRERHPIGAQVLDWSRAQVALMRPSPASRALEAILRDLIDTGDGATYFAERVWGVMLRVDLGEGHPLLGRSAPDLVLADGSRLATHLHSGRGLLLDLDAAAPLRDVATRCEGRFDYLASTAKDGLGLRALLVRPDGVVAWAGEGAVDPDAVAQAAARWWGAAIEVARA